MRYALGLFMKAGMEVEGCPQLAGTNVEIAE